MTPSPLLKNLTLLSALVVFGAGCAQEVGDINRVQPDAIDKAAFSQDKEFYFRQMVVDGDAQGSVIFQGLSSNLKRIRWVITERTLFACSTVPPVFGKVYGEQSFKGNECYGNVAAFPILAHFDVQRAYSTSTGEQSNLIIENYSDLPWYDRKYMRVDWSRNMVDGAGMWGSYFGQFSSASFTPNQDPGYVDPFRTRIEPNAEGGAYIETTTQYTYRPDIIACYEAFGDPFLETCEPGDIRVMNSFFEIRKDKDKEFEPFLHRDNMDVIDATTNETIHTTRYFDRDTSLLAEVECTPEIVQKLKDEFGTTEIQNCEPLRFDFFSRFGYFRTEGLEFDETYGTTQFSRRYLANHWNIWQRVKGPNGEPIDVVNRRPKPIVYHLNLEYPKDMIGAAKEVERQWDVVFKNAASQAMGKSVAEVEQMLAEDFSGDTRMYKIEYNGCMPNSLASFYQNKSDSDAADRSNVKDIFETYLAKATSGESVEEKLWGMPVAELRSLCGEVEHATENRPLADRLVWQREGDLRYSFFAWVEESNSRWLGYGPSAADPMTGEIISAGAHIAGTSIRNSSYYAADLIKYLNGELTEIDFLDADYVRQHLEDTRSRTEQTMAQALTPEQKREFVRRTTLDIDDRDIQKALSPAAAKKGIAARVPEAMLAEGWQKTQTRAMIMADAAREAKAQDTRFADFIKRPEVKSLMLASSDMHAMVKAMASEISFGRKSTPDDLEQAYLEINAPAVTQWREEVASRHLAENNILSAASIQVAVNSLATYKGVADFFKDRSREDIARYFAYKMMVGTQLHEVGHTVGLRHNFSASLDALNYHDEYWVVREAVAAGKITAEEGKSLSAEKMRELVATSQIKDASKLLVDYDGDPAVPDEFRRLDYINEAEFRLASVMDYTQDLTGRFPGLGKYDQAAISFVYAKKIQVWDDEVTADLPNLLSFERLDKGVDDLPLIYAGASTKSEADQLRRIRGIANVVNGRKWISIQEAMDLSRQNAKVNTSRLLSGFDDKVADKKPKVDNVVPFNFCSDERRGRLLGCDVFDWGSTYREIVNHTFDRYRVLNPMFRHNRQRLNQPYYRSTISTYVSFLANTFDIVSQPFAFYSIYRFINFGSFTDDLREAAIDAANFYTEVLSMPEPGVHCKIDKTADNLRGDQTRFWYYSIENTYMPARFTFEQGECPDQITLQPGPAQRYNFDFSNEYYFRINYVGTFIDKVIANQFLFDVSANYLFNQFLTDDRATNVSYWTLFREDMLDMMKGLMLNDYTKFGGFYDPKGNNGQGVYQPPTLVKRGSFIVDPSNGSGTPNTSNLDEGTLVPGEKDTRPHVYTPLSFNHEFNMLIYGMIANSTWADRVQDFAQYVRVAVGEREPLDFGNAELVEFYNPLTNQRYFAPQTQDGKSLTVDIIRWANELKSRWEQSVDDLADKQLQFETLRDAYDGNFSAFECGSPEQQNPDITDQVKALCQAVVEYETAAGLEKTRSEQMQDVIAKLDQIRYVWEALGPRALH